MARDRRRVRYDEDAAMVTESMSVSDDISVEKHSGEGVTVLAADVLETYASYFAPPEFKPDVVKNNNDSGICVMCGNSTAFASRKICLECIKKYRNIMFDGAQQAITDKNSEFTVYKS